MTITTKNQDNGSLQLSSKDIQEMGITVGTTLLLNGKAFKASFISVAGRRGVQQICFRGCGPVPVGDLTVEVGEGAQAVAPRYSREQLVEMLKEAEAAQA
jgi:hypothetical protein